MSAIPEHIPLSQRRERRLYLAVALNVAIVVGQIIAGLLAHSIGLIADAAHNLTDVAALALTAYALRIARRPADAKRSYGFHRSNVIAAQANAAAILVVTGLVGVEAVRRLANPEPVTGRIVLIVALAAGAANAAGMLILRETHAHEGHSHGATATSDLGMRSAVLHLASDAIASLGVAIAGAIILVTGGTYWLDPAISLLIGVAIVWQGWKLLRDTTSVLMESSPAGVDVDALMQTIGEVPGIEEVHDLHVWTLSSNVNAMSAHLVLTGNPTLEEAQHISVAAKASISAPFAIAHATFEVESETCRDDGSWCTMDTIAGSGSGSGTGSESQRSAHAHAHAGDIAGTADLHDR